MTQSHRAPYTLLYHLYRASQAARQFMRASMRDADLSGDEYGFFSFLYVNGPQPMTAIAREFDLPVTTVAGILAGAIERGELTRQSTLRDARLRPLALTESGLRRHAAAMAIYHTAYDELERRLLEAGMDVPALAAELDELTAIVREMNGVLRERARQEPPE